MSVETVVGNLISFVLLICIIFYVVTISFNLLKAQMAYMGGGAYNYGDAMQNIIVISILLAVAFAVSKDSEFVSGIITEVEASAASEDYNNIGAWLSVMKAIVSAIVGAGTLFVCVNSIWTIAKGQRDQMIGRPWQTSDALIRIGGMLVGGIFTVLSVVIAQVLVDGIASFF